MLTNPTRRDTFRTVAAGFGALAFLSEAAFPAFGADETDVPFTDIPKGFSLGDSAGQRRMLDISKIDGLITPADKFFYIQH